MGSQEKVKNCKSKLWLTNQYFNKIIDDQILMMAKKLSYEKSFEAQSCNINQSLGLMNKRG